MPTTTLNLNFPDDRTQNDFEIAFRGWLKQYQQMSGLSNALTGGGGGQAGGQTGGSTGGLTGGGSGGHMYGGQGGAQQGSTGGLLSIGSGQAGPYGVKDFYLNFIGGW